MTMPRPKGRAFKIAEDVIPGFPFRGKKKSRKTMRKGSLSKVEILQTENIEQ